MLGEVMREESEGASRRLFFAVSPPILSQKVSDERSLEIRVRGKPDGLPTVVLSTTGLPCYAHFGEPAWAGWPNRDVMGHPILSIGLRAGSLLDCCETGSS